MPGHPQVGVGLQAAARRDPGHLVDARREVALGRDRRQTGLEQQDGVESGEVGPRPGARQQGVEIVPGGDAEGAGPDQGRNRRERQGSQERRGGGETWAGALHREPPFSTRNVWSPQVRAASTAFLKPGYPSGGICRRRDLEALGDHAARRRAWRLAPVKAA